MSCFLHSELHFWDANESQLEFHSKFELQLHSQYELHLNLNMSYIYMWDAFPTHEIWMRCSYNLMQQIELLLATQMQKWVTFAPEYFSECNNFLDCDCSPPHTIPFSDSTLEWNCCSGILYTAQIFSANFPIFYAIRMDHWRIYSHYP